MNKLILVLGIISLFILSGCSEIPTIEREEFCKSKDMEYIGGEYSDGFSCSINDLAYTRLKILEECRPKLSDCIETCKDSSYYKNKTFQVNKKGITKFVNWCYNENGEFLEDKCWLRYIEECNSDKE